MVQGMLRGLAAFAVRLVLSAAVLVAAVGLVSPGNPSNTLGQAAVLSVVLSIAWYVTLARFLWFLLLPWLLYVTFWFAAVTGVYGIGVGQALLVAVGMSILSALVDWALGVKTFRKA
jgi:putative membrane protein